MTKPADREKVVFPSGDIRLEGLSVRKPGKHGVVVCHPHPLYGGNMYNPVVNNAARAFNDAGYSSLCFNFRGVGESSGSYGEGIGEREDVVAACSFLRQQCGAEQIIVAGYSFGAWVSVHAEIGTEARRLFLIAPPVAVMEMSFEHLTLPFWIVYGENDPYCPDSMLQPLLKEARTLRDIQKVEEADHFFMGREDSVAESIHLWFSLKEQEERNT